MDGQSWRQTHTESYVRERNPNKQDSLFALTTVDAVPGFGKVQWWLLHPSQRPSVKSFNYLCVVTRE